MEKPVGLTVLPASFFLLELVADKDTRKGHIPTDDFVSWVGSHEMCSDCASASNLEFLNHDI